MHSITVEKYSIKISFDKSISGWTWDKSDVKRQADSYKDYASLVILPCTGNNYKFIFNTLGDNEHYTFTESFLEQFKETLKEEKEENTKRELLKEKVTWDTIENRPYLLDYSFLPEEYRFPFKHQKLELEYASRFPAFYSLDEMGLGKTRVAIERHRVLKEKLNRIDKTLVICPVSLMYNWTDEAEKWTGKKKTVMLNGSKANKLEELRIFKNQDIDFYLINFESIASIKEELLNLVDSRTNIIIDEFIKVKNPSAKRTKNLIDICNNTKYVMGLCGTPISQGSIDIFSPSLCIDKGRKFGFSYDRFIDKYYFKEGWNLFPKRGTNEKIGEKLYSNALRFTKSDCLDIPEKRYQDILIDLPPENMRVYEQMAQFALASLEGKEVTAQIILVQLLRLSQITSGFVKTPENKILEFKKQPKLNAVDDILSSNNGSSVIIWSRFVRDIKVIADLCKRKNISFGCLIGSDNDFNYQAENKNSKAYRDSPIYRLYELIKPENNSQEALKRAYKQAVYNLHPDRNPNATKEDIDTLKKINALYTQINRFNDLVYPNIPGTASQNYYDIPENLIGSDTYTRNEIVNKFQKGHIQVIIGTASTGGLGLNLTRAKSVIYYSNDYSLINRLQSEDRAHRAGQRNQVMYYDIMARETIDPQIKDILRSKKSVADVVTRDNLRKFVGK